MSESSSGYLTWSLQRFYRNVVADLAIESFGAKLKAMAILYLKLLSVTLVVATLVSFFFGLISKIGGTSSEFADLLLSHALIAVIAAITVFLVEKRLNRQKPREIEQMMAMTFREEFARSIELAESMTRLVVREDDIVEVFPMLRSPQVVFMLGRLTEDPKMISGLARSLEQTRIFSSSLRHSHRHTQSVQIENRLKKTHESTSGEGDTFVGREVAALFARECVATFAIPMERLEGNWIHVVRDGMRNEASLEIFNRSFVSWAGIPKFLNAQDRRLMNRSLTSESDYSASMVEAWVESLNKRRDVAMFLLYALANNPADNKTLFELVAKMLMATFETVERYLAVLERDVDKPTST